MYKVTPNPPDSTLFSVVPDASNETLLTNSYETFTAISARLIDREAPTAATS